MRNIGKLLCFFLLLSMALGQIFSLGSILSDWGAISPCASEQQCQEQYIDNIMRCLSYSGHEDVCRNVIAPSYIAIGGDWATKRNKFTDLANAEKQNLSSEALKAKQEQVREALKSRYPVSKKNVISAETIFLFFVLLPIVCLLIDWYMSHKANKILLYGTEPSTLITLTFCLLFFGTLSNMGIILYGSIFNNSDHMSYGWICGMLILFMSLACLTAIGIKKEFLNFKMFAHALKKVK